MKIVCGVDFSEQSIVALDVASALAKAFGDGLVLAHVFATSAFLGTEGGVGVDLVARQREAARNDLEVLAGRLRQSVSHVETAFLDGRAGPRLVGLAHETDARMLVLALHSRKLGERLLLGSVADEVARLSDRPVMLVAGGAAGLAARLRSSSSVHLMVATDFSVATDAAIRWVREQLRRLDSDVTFVHAYWPAGEYRRLGLPETAQTDELDHEVATALEHDLKERIGELAGARHVGVRIVPTSGSTAQTLLQVARAEPPDLLVVGTHGRRGLERLWPGSVAQSVMHGAPSTVVCIPARGQRASVEQTATRYRSALAATDFTPAGDGAIRHAYGLLPAGGVMTLCHVLPHNQGGEAADRAAEEKLRTRVPTDAVSRGITTRFVLMHAVEAGQAIVQAAGRSLADVIVVGSRGSGALSGAAGSALQQVLHFSDKPVLVARARKD